MLNGKTAIVTGASRGIGRVIALTFACNGANVIINGRNTASLDQVRGEILQRNANCVAVSGDIADPETADRLVHEGMTRFGRIDILVNNAGINRRIPFSELSPQEWNELLDVNLNGTFYTCKAVLECMMRQKSGAVVNMSSSAGKTPHANAAIGYGASKGAIDAMTRQLAFDMARYGIRVNAVSPGPIETDMSKQWEEGYREALLKRIPLGRLGTAQEVANTVLFLASDLSSYITGEIVNVNGGSYMN